MNCIHHRSRQMAHTWQSIGAAGNADDIWMLPLDCSDPERPKAGKLEVFCALR